MEEQQIYSIEMIQMNDGRPLAWTLSELHTQISTTMY